MLCRLKWHVTGSICQYTELNTDEILFLFLHQLYHQIQHFPFLAENENISFVYFKFYSVKNQAFLATMQNLQHKHIQFVKLTNCTVVQKNIRITPVKRK